MVSGLNYLATVLYNAIQERTYLFERRILAFSITAVFAFPLYYVIWHDLFPQTYENLPLRLTGSALFLPLIFTKHWPSWAHRHLPIYWYSAMLYALPFFFTFMLLKNHGSTVWLLSSLIAVFLMILLLDWLNLLVQFCLGTLLAWLAYYVTTAEQQTVFISLESLPIYLFAIVLGSITNYSTETLRQERLRAMLATASNIAHELRTPLLGIKSGASGLQNYLPSLLSTYQIAQTQGLVTEPIRLAHLNAMHGVLKRIVDEAEHSNTVIDMLLMNTRADGYKPDTLSVCSIGQCVETALKRYPFASEKEKQLLVWDNAADFKFLGIELLMVHVLFNLMKNSLYHIAKSGKGSVTIQTHASPVGNVLVFRDTGAGIPPEVLPHIFSRFYSWSPKTENNLGSGIGLAFCHSVMNAFGGDIQCSSKLGHYTQFTLTFPAKNHDKT